jgi:hypothetical protein
VYDQRAVAVVDFQATIRTTAHADLLPAGTARMRNWIGVSQIRC